MVRKNIKVGSDKCVNTKIAKPLMSLIISFQEDLQKEENKRNKYKPRKISFIYASLELSRIIKNKK